MPPLFRVYPPPPSPFYAFTQRNPEFSLILIYFIEFLDFRITSDYYHNVDKIGGKDNTDVIVKGEDAVST